MDKIPRSSFLKGVTLALSAPIFAKIFTSIPVPKEPKGVIPEITEPGRTNIAKITGTVSRVDFDESEVSLNGLYKQIYSDVDLIPDKITMGRNFNG